MVSLKKAFFLKRFQFKPDLTLKWVGGLMIIVSVDGFVNLRQFACHSLEYFGV